MDKPLWSSGDCSQFHNTFAQVIYFPLKACNKNNTEHKHWSIRANVFAEEWILQSRSILRTGVFHFQCAFHLIVWMTANFVKSSEKNIILLAVCFRAGLLSWLFIYWRRSRKIKSSIWPPKWPRDRKLIGVLDDTYVNANKTLLDYIFQNISQISVLTAIHF